MNLVFLGPPGAGKGTQAIRLAEKLNLTHLSTGDLLREAVRTGSDLGKAVEEYMKSGELVPDDFIVAMLESKITAGKLDNGFILDGFPRTIPQAESLVERFNDLNISLDKVILLDVSDDEIVRRISGRWFCSECNAGYNYPAQMPDKAGFCDHDGAELKRRPDDEEEVVKNRLEVYRIQTAPIVGFFREKALLTEIDGVQTQDAVFEQLVEALK